MRDNDLFRLLVGASCVTALLAASASIVGYHLVLNWTASMPLGLYWVTPARPIQRDAIVAFPIPWSVRGLVHQRRYLPDGALLLKPVVAVEGDEVCTDRGLLTINGIPHGNVLREDSAGRSLPHQDVCGPIPRGEIFVASPNPKSFDSRTFGAVPLAALRGTVKPLWTL